MTGEKLLKIDLSHLPNDGNFKIGFRSNEFLKKSIMLGRERSIHLPSKDVHKAYFAIVDLYDIIASHNENTFQTSQGYPVNEDGRNINDRNYSDDKNAQSKVKTVAQNLQPNLIISTGAGADGTPIITIDGIVVSGNNRVMSLKLSDKKMFYREVLQRELRAGGYGLPNGYMATNDFKITRPRSADLIWKFQFPVLVRIDIDFPAYKTEEMSKYNVESKKSERGIDKAIKISRQLLDNTNCKNQLINLISQQETVSELYNNPQDVIKYRSILIDCNLINENELSKYFSGNTFSPEGKVLYSTILSSLILYPNTLKISQNSGVKSVTRSLVNAIIPAINNSNLELGSLQESINNAIIIQNAMVASGIKEIQTYVMQQEIFEDLSVDIDFKSSVVNYWMNQRANDFKKILASFNDSMEANQSDNLFGDTMSPEKIFQAKFVDPLPENIKNILVKRFDTNPTEEVSEKQIILNKIKAFEKVQKYKPSEDLKNTIELLKSLANDF